MTDFEIHLPHQPGELARVADVLGRFGVNIKSVAAIAIGDEAVLRIVPDALEAARSALQSANISFQEHELATVLLENRAGQLAEVAEKLAEIRVNLHALYVTGLVDDLVELAISVDNIEKAKAALQ
jgi:hypothetical protein